MCALIGCVCLDCCVCLDWLYVSCLVVCALFGCMCLDVEWSVQLHQEPDEQTKEQKATNLRNAAASITAAIVKERYVSKRFPLAGK